MKDMFNYQVTGAIKLKGLKRLKGRKYCGRHNQDVTILQCDGCIDDLSRFLASEKGRQ